MRVRAASRSCQDRFASERQAKRVQRRLRKSANLAPPVVLRHLLSDADVEAIFAFVEAVCECLAYDVENEDAERVVDDGSHPSDDSSDAEARPTDDTPEPGSEEWLAEQLRLSAQLSAENFELTDDFEAEDDADGAAAADPAAGCPMAQWVQCSAEHQKLFLHRGRTMRDGVWRSFAEAHPTLLGKMLAHARGQADEAGLCPAHEHLNVRCIEFHSCERDPSLCAKKCPHPPRLPPPLPMCVYAMTATSTLKHRSAR